MSDRQRRFKIQAMIKLDRGVRRPQKAFEFMNSRTHQTRDGDPSSPWVCCFGLNFKFGAFAIHPRTFHQPLGRQIGQSGHGGGFGGGGGGGSGGGGGGVVVVDIVVVVVTVSLCAFLSSIMVRTANFNFQRKSKEIKRKKDEMCTKFNSCNQPFLLL